MLTYLERRFGKFAIPNLTVILIVGQVLMFVAGRRDEALLERILLLPQNVLDGEVYRLLTFLFSPPTGQLIWAFFYWYVWYIMGTALENYWGTFRYNVFLLIGYTATIVVSFLTPDTFTTNQFVQGTVFLAFAYLNPNFELRVFFILPIRIVWLAMLTWVYYGFSIVLGSWAERCQVIASVLNFVIFFGPDVVRTLKGRQNRMLSKAKHFATKESGAFHTCAVCGITDVSHPRMEFRYCSQCSGGEAYCEAHLGGHEHVVDGDNGANS